MKRKIYILLAGFLCLGGILIIQGYYSSLENQKVLELTERSTIVVHLDKNIISGNALRTKIDFIKSSTLRNLFKQNAIYEIQAVFRNRYNVLGILSVCP